MRVVALRIDRVQVKNFRLLANAELALSRPTVGSPDNSATVVVGANNTGKTSLAEIFRRFASGKAKFKLEDFSNASYGKFCDAFEAFVEGRSEADVRQLLPYIELRITVAYDTDIEEYGPLSSFIIDVDETAATAIVVARYQLAPGKIKDLFEGFALGDEFDERRKTALLLLLGERIPSLFRAVLMAVDPGDERNVQEFKDWKPFEELFAVNFINAQRGLDDVTSRDSDVLAKILERLFTAAEQSTTDSVSGKAAEQLKLAVGDVQIALNGSFNDQIQNLMPAFGQFGYPGLGGPGIEVETTLEVGRLLGTTKVRYKGHQGVPLPESYNGLGTRNLIFILIQLLEFYRAFLVRGEQPGIQVVFIEEPEAHLHPQVQEVFIRHLNKLCTLFAELDKGGPEWPVQFVVSTHSSHIANEAPFTAIRYFVATSDDNAPVVRSTKIKDLSQGLSGTAEEDKKFLHQYLTLTRADLFFADKAILIEGTAESLLLPKIIEKFDADGSVMRLGSQYVTLLEVGGAFAHKFFPLLDFLELPTLIITDIDAVRPNEKGRLTHCLVHEGDATSNATIRNWFDDPSVKPSWLINVAEEDELKLVSSTARRRIAYQVPEAQGAGCGRTFEDAFVLANAELFGLTSTSNDEREREAQAIATERKKAEFALTYATGDLPWKTPRYIDLGIRWLSQFRAPETAADVAAVLGVADSAVSVVDSDKQVAV